MEEDALTFSLLLLHPLLLCSELSVSCSASQAERRINGKETDFSHCLQAFSVHKSLLRKTTSSLLGCGVARK